MSVLVNVKMSCLCVSVEKSRGLFRVRRVGEYFVEEEYVFENV